MQGDFLSKILLLPTMYSNLEDSTFFDALKLAIKDLLTHCNKRELMNAFYRLDLPEEETFSALSKTHLDDKADYLARLIIKRLLQKQRTRRE